MKTAAMTAVYRSRTVSGLFALVALVAGVLAMTPRSVAAQTPAKAPTAIGISVPASAQLGQSILLQARLVDARGTGIPGVDVQFTSPATFLNTSGDMVIADAMTDSHGVAAAQYEVRRTGKLTVNAVFAGSDRYAPAKTSAPLAVSGDRQLYVQDAGVKIPGLNATSTQQTSGWPHWVLSGWPIAAVLLTVWSLYGVAVFFISQIVGAGEQSGEGVP